MPLFRKRKAAPSPAYPLTDYEPVLRCSICTGEQVACFRRRQDGHLTEIMLIRDQEDWESFCESYGLRPEQVRKIY